MKVLYESEKSWCALDETVPCIIARTLQYQSNTDVVAHLNRGKNFFLQYIKDYPGLGWLNDTRHDRPIGPEVIHWTNEVMVPQLVRAGLHHIALCYTPKTFTEISLKEFSQNAKLNFPEGILHIAFFTDVEEAKEWLRQAAG